MLNVQLKRKRTFAQSVLFVVFLLSSTLAFAQNKVTGTVTDKSGEPLAGVNVLEKGTTNGCITDLDGKYSIEVKRGQTLIFTFIGFTKKEVQVNQSAINVVMEEDSQTLDEVVVVGYGSMTRKDVTSSITTVKADQLNKGAFSSPSELLQGKVPGLTVTNTSDPSGTGSITLRGSSSLRDGAAMEPYYVVDGVPGVDLALVAPEDIESIDVLRDATATAIYGSKAANGVIIVTTKKGSKERTTVSYSAYVAADNIMKRLDVMTANELRDYAKANNITLLNDEGANTNWQDEVSRTALTHNHNVSINGGNDKTTYSASINYMNKQGVIRGSDMERITARSFVQTKTLKDRLELAFSVNASITDANSVPTGEYNGESVYDAMYYYSPLAPVRNADGSWYRRQDISQNMNPMSMVHEDLYKQKNKYLQGIAKATLEIIDGLKFNLNMSMQNQQWIYSNYNSINSQLTATSSRHGQATRQTLENQKKQLEAYFNYDKTFAEKHKLGLMAGYSWEQSDDNDGFGLTAYNFYNDDLLYYNLGMANNMDIDGIWSDDNKRLSTLRMISFYGRINYSYNSKYLFQATVRRDGSSAFGRNNRWATFPSVSLAWRITEENFMKDQSLFDDLKLRIGYGVSGNSLGFNAYTALQTYSASGWFNYTNAEGVTQAYRTLAATRNANPNLKWERTGMFNVGIDFGFLGNRLTGTIEYYDKRTKDLINGYAVSTNRFPYGWMDANVGEISNKGIELTINATPVKNRNFTWETSLNLSHNKNEVISLSNSTYSVNYLDKAYLNLGGYNTANVQRIMEGQTIGSFYTWKWAGYDDSGASIFYQFNEDGTPVIGEDGKQATTGDPQNKDKVKCGNAQPKLTYGWNNTFSYKNWSLTAFIQGVLGNKIYNATRAQYSNISLVSAGKNVLADIVTEQKATDNRSQAPSDRYIENGSYLRLSTLTLSYNFGKLGDWVNSLRVYATCNNVFTLTGYKGTDPEISLGGTAPGIDARHSRYPRTRTFMFGLNVNF